jgi:hypothetical protein
VCALGQGQEPGVACDAAHEGRHILTDRPQKITFSEMRASGVRGVVVFCADYTCSHSVTLSADKWADDVGLSDIESQFVCSAYGKVPMSGRIFRNIESCPAKTRRR